MHISDDTSKVLEAMDTISENTLRKRKDIAIILETGATYDEADIINQLIFAGKSFWNISSKLKKVNPEQEGIAILQKELTRLFKQIQDLLKSLLEYLNEEYTERWENVYLQETRGCLKNVMDLSFDLSCLKDLQNISKQG